MAAIDQLMPDHHSGGDAITRGCILCQHREVWQRVARDARHNRREASRARARMLRHIKAEHPDAYAAALKEDRQARALRAKQRADEAARRARVTPFELGEEAFWLCIAAADRHNVRAGMLDRCPFEKGTPEEAEYGLGWEAARQRRDAKPRFRDD